jgi:hypothetical protein
MDWQIAISRNKTALLLIITALMKTLGLGPGGTLTTLPRALYANAILILRPAESAVRRLIVIAAHALSLQNPKPAKPRITIGRHATAFPNATNFAPSFALIEPLKTFVPNTADFKTFDTNFPAPRIPAAALGRRLLALQHALNTLDKQARRLARWYAARDAAYTQSRPHRFSPLRPGPAPASKKRPKREIEIILQECHLLALYTRERHDSS